MLRRAEEQYQENMRHRNALVSFEAYAKQPYIRRGPLKANVLGSTYPCAGEQRFGLWGEGRARISSGLDLTLCTVDDNTQVYAKTTHKSAVWYSE